MNSYNARSFSLSLSFIHSLFFLIHTCMLQSMDLNITLTLTYILLLCNRDLGCSQINPRAGFLRICTVAFLLFQPLSGALTLRGNH